MHDLGRIARFSKGVCVSGSAKRICCSTDKESKQQATNFPLIFFDMKGALLW